MKYDFTYNDITIPYEIIRKKVKNINIRIKPNCEMVVSCNKTIDNKTIELLMTKRVKWIFKTIDEYKKNNIVFSDLNNKFVDGEEFLLLGRLLRVKNIKHDKFNVKYDNNYLYIYHNVTSVRALVINWYKEHSKLIYKNILTKIYKKFKKYNIDKPSICIKKMKTRWGTCNINKGIITLNSELIKVDEFLIEYVLTHEMVHLLYKEHDKNFWSFFTMVMPDWKDREKILNSIFIS